MILQAYKIFRGQFTQLQNHFKVISVKQNRSIISSIKAKFDNQIKTKTLKSTQKWSSSFGLIRLSEETIDLCQKANEVYFIVIIKKTPLHIGNKTIKDPITEMGISHAF